MPLTYWLYALRVRCNRTIPGLVALPDTSEADVQVWLNTGLPWPKAMLERQRQTWYASANRDERGEPTLTVWKLADGAFVQFRYGDGTEFVVDRAGTRVWASWPDTLTLDDAATYLLGPVLGFVLRLRGITCLHASAIDLGDQAIAVVGPPGAGKSTTAAIFAERGYGVLSDDLVALADQRDTLLVQPGYPRLGLWPDSVEVLFGSPDLLPRQTPTWDKRYLDVMQDGYRFQRRPLPLRAVYVLSERENGKAPFADPLPAHAGLMILIENAYVSYLLDKTMRARDFDLLGRLVSSVPVRRVVPHTDSAYLSRLRDAIIDDFQALTPPSPTATSPQHG